jgi:hypothetical protein
MGACMFFGAVIEVILLDLAIRQIDPLRQYRAVIWHLYWPWIGVYVLSVYVNIVALLWMVDGPARRRARPGRKVGKLDRDFREGRMAVRLEEAEEAYHTGLHGS